MMLLPDIIKKKKGCQQGPKANHKYSQKRICSCVFSDKGDNRHTSERRSSIEAVENVGTRSEPLIIVVMKCFPDSANSHVMQAAKERCNLEIRDCSHSQFIRVNYKTITTFTCFFQLQHIILKFAIRCKLQIVVILPHDYCPTSPADVAA